LQEVESSSVRLVTPLALAADSTQGGLEVALNPAKLTRHQWRVWGITASLAVPLFPSIHGERRLTPAD